MDTPDRPVSPTPVSRSPTGSGAPPRGPSAPASRGRRARRGARPPARSHSPTPTRYRSPRSTEVRSGSSVSCVQSDASGDSCAVATPPGPETVHKTGVRVPQLQTPFPGPRACLLASQSPRGWTSNRNGTGRRRHKTERETTSVFGLPPPVRTSPTKPPDRCARRRWTRTCRHTVPPKT